MVPCEQAIRPRNVESASSEKERVVVIVVLMWIGGCCGYFGSMPVIRAPEGRSEALSSQPSDVETTGRPSAMASRRPSRKRACLGSDRQQLVVNAEKPLGDSGPIVVSFHQRSRLLGQAGGERTVGQ